ncbi:PTS sugar transporter subunit IIC, partial [Paraclostridium sordellii]|uniref:PTS sugar transporter subunit IIC n=1 Tax=Paraclostridium sordellii TaxID=1505 RepID=UPI003A87AD7F
SPIIMGIIIGGFFTLISTSPLSSMALTAMLGLTGVPMAIAIYSLNGLPAIVTGPSPNKSTVILKKLIINKSC